MKLRRALAAAAATAAIAPLALLSAPAAFADGETPTVAESTPAAEDSTPAADESTPAAEDSTPASDESTPAAEDSTPASDESTPADGEASPSASSSPSDSTPPSPSPSAGNSDFDPYNDCKSLHQDDQLTATISGLPGKIVAGSGWHNFKFAVENDSDKDLKNVWVNALTEYNDDVHADDSLSLNLATIQVKQDGKWSNTYHESFGSTTLTGSFAAVFDTLQAHTSTALDLRVSVKASAPAGSSFALSQAVYAGKGTSCYGNGDFYDFEVLAAGSKTPGDVGDSKPNGKKPSSVNENVKPQGGVKPVTGSLAETGSSSALPMIGLAGGLAVVAGAGAVFVVRRRKSGDATA
ncbi:LPXTG cell wall anchor domain-containing protein [Streptomyces sp. NBC_00996]|nr:LPXTG cell wall anchor domain-containing protein [Streptomyces sp. NBC_00996]